MPKIHCGYAAASGIAIAGGAVCVWLLTTEGDAMVTVVRVGLAGLCLTIGVWCAMRAMMSTKR